MLTELIFSLRECPPLERSLPEMARLLGQAMARVDGRRLNLIESPGSYSRTCAYFDDRFEVLLLNWSPGAASSLHDHGGQHCWLAVLDGRVELENYDRLDAGDEPGYARVASRDGISLECGGMDLRNAPIDIHRVCAGAASGAVTLHVYARPLRQFTVYDELSHRCRLSRPKYDAVLPYRARETVA